MIQFNLLPDVKLEYIKATYRRRIITLVSLIIAGSFLTIFVLMFMFVRVNQQAQLKDLDKDIAANLNTLKENKDLDKVLTIQNQLSELPRLHEEKAMTSRVFDYMTQLKHDKMFVTSLSVDTEGNTMAVKGETDSIASINKFVDTLKFTKYTQGSGDSVTEGQAFSSVVLNNFSLATAGNNAARAASFEVSFNFDPMIFKNTAAENKPLENGVKLVIPSIISTPSETQKPSITSIQQSDTQNQGGSTQ